MIGALRTALAALALLAGCHPAGDATPPRAPTSITQQLPTAPSTPAVVARESAANALAPDEIGLAQLPPEARDTLRRIRSGGPFAYERDGAVFGNREGHLPKRPRGYYTEYTVRTPGSRDRGARRIVAGQGASGNPATGGEYWYTADHYNSFRRIRE